MLNLDRTPIVFQNSLEMIACARMPAEQFYISIACCSHANAYMRVISANPIACQEPSTRRMC